MVWGVFSLRFPGEIKRLWRGRRIFQVAKWRRQKSRTCPSLHPRFPAAASGRWLEKTGGLEYEITRVQKLNVYDKYTKQTRWCALFFSLSHVYYVIIYVYLYEYIYIYIYVYVCKYIGDIHKWMASTTKPLQLAALGLFARTYLSIIIDEMCFETLDFKFVVHLFFVSLSTESWRSEISGQVSTCSVSSWELPSPICWFEVFLRTGLLKCEIGRCLLVLSRSLGTQAQDFSCRKQMDVHGVIYNVIHLCIIYIHILYIFIYI